MARLLHPVPASGKTGLALPTPRIRWRWLIVAGAGAVMGVLAAQAANSSSVLPRLALVAALVPPIAAIVGGVRRMLLAAIVLDIPLMWDINLFYRGDGPYPGGLNVSLTTIALLGLYALWLARVNAEPDAPARPIGLPLVAVVYVGSVAASLLVAQDKVLALFSLLLLAQGMLTFLYLANTLNSEREIVFVMVILLIGILAESTAVLASYALGHDFAFAGIAGHAYPTENVDAIYRPGGTIGSPNVAGSFLGIALAPALAMVAAPLRRNIRWLATAAFAMGLLALMATASRGGWLAFVTSTLVLGVLLLRRRLVKPLLPVTAVVVIALAALAFAPLISQRLAGDDQGAAASRIPLMQIAWDMIKAHPLTGVGVNNFSVVINDYAGSRVTGEWLAIVHNQYLLVWAEAGLVALLAFIGFLGFMLRRAWRATFAANRVLACIAAGLCAALVGTLPNMLVERFSHRPQVGLLWLTAALAVSLEAITRDPARGESPARDVSGAKPW